VFNTSFGKKDEREKIFFFHPTDTRWTDRVSHLGFCEAIINFTTTFAQIDQKTVDAVHMEKSRHVFFQCEPNTWMVMVVNNPCLHKTPSNAPPFDEYLVNDLDDKVLKAVLQQIYNMFRLFSGTFQSILDRFSVKALVNKLEVFMPYFIDSIDFDKLNFFDALAGLNIAGLRTTPSPASFSCKQ